MTPPIELDPGAVRQLRDLSDADGDLLRYARDLFARDTPERIGAMRAAFEAHDPLAAAAAAHALKGSAANVGARELVGLCQRIEDRVGAPSVEADGPGRLLAALEREAAAAQLALDELVDGL